MKHEVDTEPQEYTTQIRVNKMPVGVTLRDPSLAGLIATWLRTAVDQIEQATAKDRKDEKEG